jgi:hypothetical protein
VSTLNFRSGWQGSFAPVPVNGGNAPKPAVHRRSGCDGDTAGRVHSPRVYGTSRSEARDSQILVSSRIAGAVEALVKLKDLGNPKLKGYLRQHDLCAADARVSPLTSRRFGIPSLSRLIYWHVGGSTFSPSV